MKKALIIFFTVLPYLIFCFGAIIGHLLLCLRHLKRPVWGMIPDLVFLYKRFVQDLMMI